MQEVLKQFVQSKGTTAEPFRRCFRYGFSADLSEKTILSQQVWRDADDQARFFFQPVRRQEPVTGAAASPDDAQVIFSPRDDVGGHRGGQGGAT